MLFRETAHRTGEGEAEPTGAEPRPACGHDRHRGSCPDCQRVQLERWRSQLKSVAAANRR